MNGLLEQLDRWLPQARARVAAHGLAPRLEQIGRIETVGDGIARVSGLPEVRLDELLMLGAGTPGFAFTLEPDAIGCILLGETEALSAGDPVHATGAVLTVPVGEGLLGRVIDPLGAVLDGGAAIEPTRHDRIEPPAPEIVDRDLVTEPLATGVLAIDALFPLGRGQRELIIGDRATGKSALALDTIINQRDSDVICIYVAVGQKSSAVKAAIQGIRTHGALERCLFVVAAPEAPAGLRWLAPYAGFTMGEYFRDQGGHVLVVIDDLTTHATTHRELSLLLRQPPGREAFPGDVFYLHARLLERAAKLSKEKGAGSLSALPIAQTQAGNLSAYIPTNLISITDGQFYIDAKLFHEGQRPAVDIGRSVSRVGGKTQPPVLRQVSGRLRLEYAQFLELEVFTRFGGMVDARTRRTIEHGRRIRAVLAQGQYEPQPMPLQVALLLALDERLLDELPLEAVAAFRERLADWLAEHAAGAWRRIEAGAMLDDDLRASLLAALRALAASLAGD